MSKASLPFDWSRVTRPAEVRLRGGLAKLKRLKGKRRESFAQSLQKHYDRSVASVDKRRNRKVCIKYPPELPVSQQRNVILEAIKANQVVIVCGDTGSGKTTQLPKMLYEAGYGITGRIGCTQPRRLAAVSMAQRVAEEMGVEHGTAVGHHVRFDESFDGGTSIKFMTDGILLAESQRDRLWLQYDALIIDEAHERSLNIDFILGCLLRLLSRRPDLKVVISSATLDAERFSAFFNDAPVIKVEGRRFPVEDFYLPPQQDDEELSRHILRGVQWISEVDARGDILVFLPGEREIHDAADLLGGRKMPNTDILPLYARLGMQEQRKVFQTGRRRRIVLATNVAETSITIPGIHYVIDSGLARVKRYNPRLQFERLQIEQVSQASADQRRGRCGRIADGICVRLYDQDTYDESDAFTAPEIQRTSLEDVILHMKMTRMPDIEDFPFIDPPRMPLIREGYKTLIEIGALDENQQLTALGRSIGRFQVDPRIARMILEAVELKVADEVIAITAALSIQDPRERPNPEQRAEADAAQSEWLDERSDFMTLLNLWNELERRRGQGQSKGSFRRFCRAHFLNVRRVQEWVNLVREIYDSARDAGVKITKTPRLKQEEYYRRIHCSLLAGIPMQIGCKHEQQPGYQGTRGKSFFLFPASGLFGKSHEWLMAFELVETSKLYARKAAVIDPEWVEEVAPHVCKASYSSPRWNGRKGFVYADKALICGGLTLLSGKRVHYGPVNPVEARDIFIRQGLVPADMRIRGRWFKQYRQCLTRIRDLETRIRRPESLLDHHGLIDRFEQQLPESICTARDFEKWLHRHYDAVPIAFDDMLLRSSIPFSADAYPDQIEVEGVPFKLEYYFEPGEPVDGICLVCPVEYAYLVTEATLDWGIPGWLAQKIQLLLKTVTKRIRRQLVPLPTTADRLAAELAQDEKAHEYPLTQVLADRLHRELDEIVGAGDFEPSRLPSWMTMRVRIVDPSGKTLVETRDMDQARQVADSFGGKQGTKKSSGKKESHKKPIKKAAPAYGELWDLWCGKGLPEKSGRQFVALQVVADAVRPFLFNDHADAECAHRGALVHLLRQQISQQVRFVEKRLPLGMTTRLQLSVLSREYDHLADFITGAVAAVLLQVTGGKLPRNQNELENLCEACRAELYGSAEESAKRLERIFERLVLVENEQEKAGGGSVGELLFQDVCRQKQELFFNGFLLYPEWFPDLERWMSALLKRLERAGYNLNKDREKQQRTDPFSRICEERIRANGAQTCSPKLIEQLHSLQEFRVTVFAPETGTRIKVSEKKMREIFGR